MNRSYQQPTACVLHYDSDSDGLESVRDHALYNNSSISQTVYRYPSFSNIKDNLSLHSSGNVRRNDALSKSWNGKLCATQYRNISESKSLTGTGKFKSESTSALSGSSRWKKNPPSLQIQNRVDTSLSLPSLRTKPGDTSLTTSAEYLEDPKWNGYLNAWVSSKMGKSNTYITLAGSVDILQREFHHFVPEFEDSPVMHCPRFMAHMHKSNLPKLPEVKTRKRVTERPKFWVWKKKAEPAVLPKPLPPKPGIDEKEDFSDYGSIKSGVESDVQSEGSKRTVVSLTSGHTPNNGLHAVTDDKPIMDLYCLSASPMTPSSMDWEMAHPLSPEGDGFNIGVSPSKLEKLFLSNDYFEILEVPTFGQVKLLNLNLYEEIQLYDEPDVSAGNLKNIQPPARLVIQGPERITVLKAPEKPVPVPEVVKSTTPPPPKDPTPEPLPPPKTKKKEKQSKPKKKKVPTATLR